MKALLLAAALYLTVPLAHAADPATITQSELVRRTQVLYDAVAPGDQAPWKLYYADDAMIFDEKGRDMDKAALVADVTPMPAGYSGSIRVENARARFATNVAILGYDAIETETVFGRVLHARYHSTDTWLYRNQFWQIVSSQTLRYYEDPAEGSLNAAMLADYVGTYELSPGNRLNITRKGNSLFSQRGAAKPVALLPESPDMFFRKGVEGRRLFHRDVSGKVDMLIDRRNNEDLLWKKIS